MEEVKSRRFIGSFDKLYSIVVKQGEGGCTEGRPGRSISMEAFMKTVDRRNFLRGAAVAMAATSGSAAANGKIRAGILGTQHSHVRGKLRAMRNSPDYEVVSVCEPEEEVRKQRQGDPLYKGLQWASEEELLADSSIRLVVVECNVWQAIPWGTKVIAANKHLHLEKPPSDEFAPFRELVEDNDPKRTFVGLRGQSRN